VKQSLGGVESNIEQQGIAYIAPARLRRPSRWVMDPSSSRDEEKDAAAAAWQGERPPRSWHADGCGGGGQLPRRGSGIPRAEPQRF